MKSKILIYHNPRCRKSREALDYLNNSGIDYNLVLYLSNPLSKITLENLLFKLKINAIDLIRKNELLWKSEFSKKKLTENEIISIMLENPKLIERPIIENENSAVVGRPMPSNNQSIIVNNIKIITLSLAMVSITIIKLVLSPVDPTAPTIIPAVAIAIPTPTILIAPF